jgi:hypothetical protein
MLLRRYRLSLGLPIAYLIALLLIHVPGAFVQVTSDAFAYDAELVNIGIRYTAIGALCFVSGVHIARVFACKERRIYAFVERREFWYFCLIGGLLVTIGLGALQQLPSVRSAIDRGGALWMLGVLLGIRFALSRGDLMTTAMWAAAALIYPTLMLLVAGFLSYGAAALIIVLAPLIVSVRSLSKLIIVGVLGAFIGATIFVNYFAHRKEYRMLAWSNASLSDRVDGVVGMFSNFEWFDPSNAEQLRAFDLRLNQNYFVGLAVERLNQQQVSYLKGRSIWEGFLALVPRFIWPEKTVFGGSGTIVAEMTGIQLNETTSWGVGNVMEFQINFGMAGVVIGFLMLGFVLGWLDYKAALSEARGDLTTLISFFLVGVALISPGGSIVEMTGGAAAAAVASVVWKWLWQLWLQISRHSASGRFAAPR